MSVQRLYLRGLGIFFILVVITFVLDILKFGWRAETLHKLLHVLLGVWMVWVSYQGSVAACRTFNKANGALFVVVAGIGWSFPDLGGLDAFNLLDTILHSIVGISSGWVGMWAKD